LADVHLGVFGRGSELFRHARIRSSRVTHATDARWAGTGAMEHIQDKSIALQVVMTVVPLPPLQPPGKPAGSEAAGAPTGRPPERLQLPLRTRALAGLVFLALAWALFTGLVMGVAELFR
jgi:hypothetical protein